MLPLSLCRLWQPDRAANAAQDTRSYTTARGTIRLGHVPFERKLVEQSVLPALTFPHHRQHSNPPDRIESPPPCPDNSRFFQHRVMVAALLQKPIGSALSLEEESQHGVFCRAGRVDGGNADLRHGAKRLCHSQGEGAVYAGGYRGRACAASNLPTHRIRDRPNGSDALPWFTPTRTAGYLRRKPAGVSGADAVSDAQDRPQ